jgi:hypothetical protein
MTIVSLGKRLVQEFGIADSNDTLSRWMAHYIAAKLEEVQSTKGKKKEAAERECFNSILELWEHRTAFAANRRPFRDFESLFGTLSTLDVENPPHRYFRNAQAAAAGGDVGSKSTKWLDAATSVDAAARVLIRYCLSAAVESAVDKTRDWIRLVDALDLPRPFDVRIVRFVTDDVDALKNPTPSDLQRERLQGLLKHLELFMTLSGALAKQLSRQLRASKPAKKRPKTSATKRRGKRRTSPGQRRRR